jgi:uncharacterized membrane protein YozB (DUF420 family)
MSLMDLPTVNASLNALSALCLLIGYYHIRRGNRSAHRKAMLGAFGASALFLVCYITYHAYVSYVLKRGPTVFRNPEWFRPVYLLILLTHTVLAAAVVPMSLLTLWQAWKGRFEAHKRLARWTWPIWMYASITGVLIYLLLYVIFRQ